jgi:hypothetical protein
MLGEQHPETLSTLKAIARILRLQDLPEEAEEIQFTVYTRLKRKNGLEHPETLRAMNELADLYMDSGKQVDAFQLSNETLIIELRIMGELDPMTLQTRYRIGKLHYLAERKEEAMEELGDVLAKQEKLLGFDHSEVTKTRDLLNEILAERATPVIFLDQNSTPEIPTESETKRSGFLDNFQDDNSSFDNNSTILNDELNSSAEMNDDNHSVLILEMPEDSPEHAPVTITEELENKDENATQPDERKVGDDKDTSGFLNRFKKLIPKKSNP